MLHLHQHESTKQLGGGEGFAMKEARVACSSSPLKRTFVSRLFKPAHCLEFHLVDWEVYSRSWNFHYPKRLEAWKISYHIVILFPS